MGNLIATGSEKADAFYERYFEQWRKEWNPEPNISVMELGGRLAVYIRVEEETTFHDLEGCVKQALKWRNRLLEFQGYQLFASRAGFMEKMRWLIANKRVTSREYAQRINDLVAVDLSNFADVLKRAALPLPRFETWDDVEHWNGRIVRKGNEEHTFTLYDTSKWLGYMKVRHNRIIRVINEGLESILKGERPFYNDYPVSAKQVREQLKYWKKSEMGKRAHAAFMGENRR